MGKYIQKLTQQDIEEFLKANNFVLCYDIKNDKNETLPAIERSPEMIFIRCRRVLTKDEQNINNLIGDAVAKNSLLAMMAFMSSIKCEYSSDIDLITLYDYDANLLTTNPQDTRILDNLFHSYIDFMRNKFKSTNYDSDLKIHYERLLDLNNGLIT